MSILQIKAVGVEALVFQWTPVLNSKDDLFCCWVTNYFCLVQKMDNQWEWIVTNFHGRLEHGLADSLNSAVISAQEKIKQLSVSRLSEVTS